MSTGADRSEKGLESTTTTWQPYAKSGLTEDDAMEIRANIGAFISLLIEWSRGDTGHDQQDTRTDSLKENA